jgi:DNA-directed RNA polymerase subunit K/omega
LQTAIFRGEGANAKQIPMTAEKFTDMRCPNEKNIVVTLTEKAKGGEKIDLFGTPR